MGNLAHGQGRSIQIIRIGVIGQQVLFQPVTVRAHHVPLGGARRKGLIEPVSAGAARPRLEDLEDQVADSHEQAKPGEDRDPDEKLYHLPLLLEKAIINAR